MKYEAGNRFNPETYFKTEVDSDTSVTVKVTGELEGVEVSFDSGDVPEITSLSVTENGSYEAPEGTAYDPVTVEVPNSYTAADEGKVVSSGALVSQTSTTKTANGTYDTTTNNEVVIEVPNSYTAADEGKVVSSGALVSQTSRTVTANDTYDTTTNNEVVVAVPGPSGSISITQNGTVDVSQYASADVNVPSGAADLINVIERDITSLDIPAGATSIGKYSLSYCDYLVTVVIPAGVTLIDEYAFSECSRLVNVDIPEGVTTISNNAFNSCGRYKNPVFPSTITSFGGGFPLRNISLETLTIKATTPPPNVPFNNAPSIAIYVPAEAVETYKAASGWSNHAAKIQAIPTT